MYVPPALTFRPHSVFCVPRHSRGLNEMEMHREVRGFRIGAADY